MSGRTRRSLALGASLLTGQAAAAEPVVPAVIAVEPAGGAARAVPGSDAVPSALAPGDAVALGDVISTDAHTWVLLLWPPACQVWIAPSSQVVVGSTHPEATPAGALDLLVGAVRVTLGSLLGFGEPAFSVTAESVVAAPQGTDFEVARGPWGAAIRVLDGAVRLSGGDQASVVVRAGQSASLWGEGAWRPAAGPPLVGPPPALPTLGVGLVTLALTPPGAPVVEVSPEAVGVPAWTAPAAGFSVEIQP